MTTLNAQGQFLTEITVDTSTLAIEQKNRLGNLEEQSNVTETRFVTVGDLAQIQQDGWLDLNIPGKNCIPSVKAKHVESDTSGNYYWYGEVVKNPADTSCNCYDGFVNLMSRGGKVIGSFAVDNDRYELHAIGDNHNVLVKKDYINSGLSCGNTEEGEGFTGGEVSADSRSESNCPTRVLALYTENARMKVGSDIEDIIELAITQSNQALKNSDLGETEVFFDLVQIDTIDFTEGPSIAKDLDTLIGLPYLQQKRDAVHADIVVVYTYGLYGGAIGRAGTLQLNADSAVAIVQAHQAANSAYNDAHEMAHLFGCRHETESDPTGIFEHAYEFKACKKWYKHRRRTIMWRFPEKIIPHYSNPDVKYNNESTGVLNERDNARQLGLTSCTVSGFRTGETPPPFVASIRKPYFACPCITRTFFADVFGGTGAYQYEWRSSTDGFTWTPVLDTTSYVNIVMPCTLGDGIFIRLTVSDANGATIDKYEFIEVALEWPNQQIPCDQQIIAPEEEEDLKTYSTNPLAAKLIPNPATGKVHIHLSEIRTGNINLQLTDRLGNVVLKKTFQLPLYSAQSEIDLTSFPKGIYYLQIWDGSEIVTKKLLKL